jgi:hypothetical protein
MEGSGFRDFIRSFWPNYFALMSGGWSVPAAIAAFFVTNETARNWLWATAGVCAVLAAYLVWKPERKKVIGFRERLTPRIHVFLEAPHKGVQGFPLTDGSLSKYIQFTVTPCTESPLVDCEAWLTSVVRINADGTTQSLAEEHVHWQWSNCPTPKVTINVGINQRANMFWVNDKSEDTLTVDARPGHVRLLTEIQTKGDYRIGVSVTAVDVPTKHTSFVFHWGGYDDVYLIPES